MVATDLEAQLDEIVTDAVVSTRRGLSDEEVISSTKQALTKLIENLADEQHAIGMKNGRFGYISQAEHKRIIADREREARIDEAKGYCDSGHYHDKERDLAMLPSERYAELERKKEEL